MKASRPPSESPTRDEIPQLLLDERGPMLSIALWVILVGAAIFMALMLLSPVRYQERIYVPAGVAVLAVIAQFMYRSQGAVPVLRLLVIGGWLLVTAGGLVGEGVRAPILIAYPVILVVAGWMLGTRYCIALSGASVAAVVLLAVGQQTDLKSIPAPVSTTMVAVVQVLVLVITTLMTVYLFKVFSARYADVRRLNGEIETHLQTIEKRENYQRALLNNFPFMVWLKDEQGRYLAVNQAFLAGFGWPSAEALIGKTDLDIAASNLAAKYRKDDLTVFASSSSKIVEELIEIRGLHRWFETCKSPVTGDGQVIGMVGYARDITERKASEAAIAESQNLIRAVIDTAPVRVFWKDRDLRYLGCNEAFARDAGMAHPEDLIGKDDYQLAWADQAEAYRIDDRAVMETGLPKLSFEEPQTTPTGRLIRLRTSKVPLRNKENEIIGVLGMYEEIAEHK